MTKDYAKQFAKPARKARKPFLTGFLLPIILIAIVVAGIWFWREHYRKDKAQILKKEKHVKVLVAVSTDALQAPADPDKPHFEFYTMLPKIQVGTNDVNTAMPVTTQQIKTNSPASTGNYFLQLGTFHDRASAEQFKNQLGNLGVGLHIDSSRVKGQMQYRLTAGPFNDEKAARAMQVKLAASKVKSFLKKQ